MPRSVKVATEVAETLRAIAPRTRDKILRAIERLGRNPYPRKRRVVEGSLNLLAIRVGAFRISYIIQPDCVLVIRIAQQATAWSVVREAAQGIIDRARPG